MAFIPLTNIIKSGQANVVVIGLGYVGLPMAVEQAKAGFQVNGIDKSVKKVSLINSGNNYIPDVNESELRQLVLQGRLTAHNDFDCLAKADIIIICVPTPLTSSRDPDVSEIVAVADKIAEKLRKGQLVTLESTTYPGTTEQIILPKLRSTGLKEGRDFFLAYSPERVDPGNKTFSTKNITKIVGGVTPACLDVACTFYTQTINQVIPVTSPAVAEMTKVFENTYRAVNIALVNEFMFICDRIGLNVWEIIDAAGTKPFGMQVFYPGPGVGGHCIPVDPLFVSWKAKEYDFYSNLIEVSAQVNVKASYFVAGKVWRVLNKRKKSMSGSRILVIGAAYKKDIDDSRESPAIKIMSILSDSGAEIVYHDPYIPNVKLASGRQLESVILTHDEIAGADCVIIATDHSCFDYQMIADKASVIIDTRNATKGITASEGKIIKI